jgi:hypothetical protein
VAPILKKTEKKLKKAGREVEAFGKEAHRDTVKFGKKVDKKLRQ